MMRIVVLGSAAGGGVPQWNSNGEACRRARAGDPVVRCRTQAAIAVAGEGPSWTVVNAAPDLRQQIEMTPELQPKEGLRSTPIGAVVLTAGEVDCVAGLLHLRERQPFALMATSGIHQELDANPIFEVLDRWLVQRRAVPLEEDVALPGDVTLRLFPVPGKVPLYREGSVEATGATGATEDATVGACLSHRGGTLFYIPGCAAMTPALAARLRGADMVMFDGTLWSDDEMIRKGLGAKTGRRMGHMSLSGAQGTLAAFAELGVKRKILLHINNSNPILIEDSPEHAEAVRAGWQVAFDGMRLSL